MGESDYAADLEAEIRGLREDNERLVRDNERLEQDLYDAREEIRRLREAAGGSVTLPS
jgi:hypothetical protein